MAMDGHHGNTWANWAGVALGMVGVVIAAVAVMLSPANWLLFWIGLALLPVAALLVVVLNNVGLGVKHAKH